MNFIVTFLKGIAMGAADVVPGVSGGTIAYLTGIYQRLLDAIHAAGGPMWIALRKEGIASAWKVLDGWFVLSLFAGIAVSILSLSKVVLWGLDQHPTVVWSFFFGLIVASLKMLSRDVKGAWFMLGLGIVLGLLLSSMPAGHVELTPIFTFFAGFLAICAMILPGISGSFILVLLGAYEPILNALHDRELGIVAIFASGCLIGLLTFGRLLRWLFKRFEQATVSLMTGFIVGSLVKVWPLRGLQNGWEVPVSPSVWQVETGLSIPWLAVVLAALLGGFLVLGLDQWSQRGKAKP
jgi:putative membrane protein